MREILFKGKRKDNGEWVEGSVLKSGNGYVDIVPFDNSICEDEFGALCAMVWYEADPETVCQYTGLTDKNGRKIFEGDIVRLPKCENDIAVFALTGCNYFLKGKRSDYVLGSMKSDCYEVIGNIFDNPELIAIGAMIDEKHDEINEK